MAIQHWAGLTTGTASGTGALAIRPATTARAYILEVGLFLNAATASVLTLKRSASAGTPSTSVLGQQGDPADAASATNIDTVWSVVPTVAANAIRRIALPATSGAGVIWTFPRGALVAANGATTQLLVWNEQLNSALNAYVVWEE